MFLLPLVFIAYFFSGFFLVINRKMLRKSTYFLSLFYFLWGSAIFSLFVVSEKDMIFSENFTASVALLFFVFMVAIPPTVYVYSRLLQSKFQESIVEHYYITFLLLIINFFSILYLDSKPDTFFYELNENVLTYINYLALLFIFPLINVFYIYKSLSFYFSQKKNSKNENEVIDNRILFFILGYLGFLLLLFLDIMNIIPKSLKFSFVLYSSVYFIFIGYNEFVRERRLLKGTSNAAIETEDEMYLKTFEDIDEKLNQLLKEKKPYLDSKLTLNQLAKLLGSNERSLSAFLNTTYGVNFSTFINSHRIEESKQLLLSVETTNFTIETIANMAGFHSKSTFNTAFKTATNLTPSEFKRTKLRE